MFLSHLEAHQMISSEKHIPIWRHFDVYIFLVADYPSGATTVIISFSMETVIPLIHFTVGRRKTFAESGRPITCCFVWFHVVIATLLGELV